MNARLAVTGVALVGMAVAVMVNSLALTAATTTGRSATTAALRPE